MKRKTDENGAGMTSALDEQYDSVWKVLRLLSRVSAEQLQRCSVSRQLPPLTFHNEPGNETLASFSALNDPPQGHH